MFYSPNQSSWQWRVVSAIIRNSMVVMAVLVVVDVISAIVEWRWLKKQGRSYAMLISYLPFGIAAIILCLWVHQKAGG